MKGKFVSANSKKLSIIVGSSTQEMNMSEVASLIFSELKAMNVLAGYKIRPLTPADQPFLWEMLYHSLFVPEGCAPFARDIINHPEIAKYVKEWGREGDVGFVAVDEHGRSLGAIWLRLLRGEEKGYGYVDDRTPEIGMAVLPAYRGQGIGRRLLAWLLTSAQGRYEEVSLSVAADNPARRLYQRLGFEMVEKAGASITMKRKVQATSFQGAT